MNMTELEARAAEAVHREAAQWLRDVDLMAWNAWIRALADMVSVAVARRQAEDMPKQHQALFRAAVREAARSSALEALGHLGALVERLPSTSEHWSCAWSTTEACERLVDAIERSDADTTSAHEGAQ